jgi:hypothetical protein
LKDEADRKKKREEEEEEAVDFNQLKRQMCEYLKPNETVQRAISRIGALIKKEKQKNRQQKGRNRSGGRGGEGGEGVEKGKKRKPEENKVLEEYQKQCDFLTGAAMKFFSQGDVKIYDYTRERLLLSLKHAEGWTGSSGNSHETSSSSSSSSLSSSSTTPTTSGGGGRWQWEYKMPKEENKVYGPHSTEQMAEWWNGGYFQGPTVAWVRRTRKEGEGGEGGGEESQNLNQNQNQNQNESAKEAERDGQQQKRGSSDDAPEGEWVLSDKVNFSAYL